MGVKEDIDILDSKVSRLRVEYEQYFLRVLKREPLQLRDEVERLILVYSNRSITNTSQKFRFNTVVSKYTAYKQYWTRVVREIEEGTYLRKAEADMKMGVSAPGPGAPEALDKAIEAGEEGEGGEGGEGREERITPPTARPARPAPSTPPPPSAQGNGALTEAYKQYLDAKTRCKEKTNGLTFDSFVKTVEKTKQKIEEKYRTKDVDLKIQIKDGQAKITITPKGK